MFLYKETVLKELLCEIEKLNRTYQMNGANATEAKCSYKGLDTKKNYKLLKEQLSFAPLCFY